MKFGGDYTVMPEKIVQFLTCEIFTRRKIIVIDLEAGYKGVIGLRQYDPQEFPDLAKTEEREILAKFCSGMEYGNKGKEEEKRSMFNN